EAEIEEGTAAATIAGERAVGQGHRATLIGNGAAVAAKVGAGRVAGKGAVGHGQRGGARGIRKIKDGAKRTVFKGTTTIAGERTVGHDHGAIHIEYGAGGRVPGEGAVGHGHRAAVAAFGTHAIEDGRTGKGVPGRAPGEGAVGHGQGAGVVDAAVGDGQIFDRERRAVV